MSDEPKAGNKRCRGRGKMVFWSGLVLAGACVALAGLQACRGHGGCHHRRGDLSAEDARERLGHVAEHALSKVDATDAQRQQVNGILDGIAPQLVAMHKEKKALGERLIKALEADEVDAGELQTIRTDALALAERASQTVVDALARVTDLLEPEQRRELIASLCSPPSGPFSLLLSLSSFAVAAGRAIFTAAAAAARLATAAGS